MRRPVFLRPGQHASRRAPPDFVGQNKPANVSHWHSCPHAMRDGTAGGRPPSFLGALRLPEAVRLTQKVGGRAPLRLLAGRGVAPRSSTAAWGRLNPLGRILLGGSPQPQLVPARAGCRLTDSDRVRGLVPLLPAVGCPSRLRARSPYGWRNGSHSTRCACCAPATQACELRCSHVLCTSLALRAVLARCANVCPCYARTEYIFDFRFARYVLFSEKPFSIYPLFSVSITRPASPLHHSFFISGRSMQASRQPEPLDAQARFAFRKTGNRSHSLRSLALRFWFFGWSVMPLAALSAALLPN